MDGPLLPLAPPPDFRLRPTVLSHGWSDLAPFDADASGKSLLVRMRLEGAGTGRASRQDTFS